MISKLSANHISPLFNTTTSVLPALMLKSLPYSVKKKKKKKLEKRIKKIPADISNVLFPLLLSDDRGVFKDCISA